MCAEVFEPSSASAPRCSPVSGEYDAICATAPLLSLSFQPEGTKTTAREEKQQNRGSHKGKDRNRTALWKDTLFPPDGVAGDQRVPYLYFSRGTDKTSATKVSRAISV